MSRPRKPQAATTTRLVCGCCGVSAEFPSQDEALAAGWDTPVRFGYSACSLCPGVGVYFPMYFSQQARTETDFFRRADLLAHAAAWSHHHDHAHERWAREGRPSSFEESLALGDVGLQAPPEREE